jgi:hypothetical protein
MDFEEVKSDIPSSSLSVSAGISTTSASMSTSITSSTVPGSEVVSSSGSSSVLSIASIICRGLQGRLERGLVSPPSSSRSRDRGLILLPLLLEALALADTVRALLKEAMVEAALSGVEVMVEVALSGVLFPLDVE